MTLYIERFARRLHRAKIIEFSRKIQRQKIASISGEKIRIFSIIGGTVLFNYLRNPMPSPGGALSTGIENLDGYPQ